MLKKAGRLLKTTVKRWWDMDPFREGAIIAYYAIFALPGLLVVVITVAGYFFGADAVSGQVNQDWAYILAKPTRDRVMEQQDLQCSFCCGHPIHQ